MTQTELAWYSALNYFTPIIYNGIKRGDRATTNYLRMPRVKLALGQRTPMKKDQIEELMNIIRALAPDYYSDKIMYEEKLKNHPIVTRKNGTKYSRHTVLSYINKVRKEPGMQPEDTNSKAYRIKECYENGMTIKEIAKVTETFPDYCRRVIRKLAK